MGHQCPLGVKGLIKPTPSWKTLQSLQGQLAGTHILMDFLKLFDDFWCLVSSGTISYILGPRYEILSVPWKTLFTWEIVISAPLRKLYWMFVLSIKILLVISGYRFKHFSC